MKKNLIKKSFILGIGLLTLVIITESIIKYQKTKPLCKNCDVLLVSIDTLSAKHLPCYGYDKDTAPNLCQFGKDNILFENSYSQSYWTRASQTSVLTGLHVSTHGVETAFINKLLPQFKTIAQILKDNSYKTYYFGPDIDDVSWDESVVKGFDYMENKLYKYNSLDHWQKALDILEENKKSKTPTFMYLHTYYVHTPYATKPDELKFAKKEDQKKYPEIPLTFDDYNKIDSERKKIMMDSLEERIESSPTEESKKMNIDLLTKIKGTTTSEELQNVFNSLPKIEVDGYVQQWYFMALKNLENSQYIASLYDEGIYQMDTELKNFLERLKGKFAKDTVVIIYSDHGETVGERGSYVHCWANNDCLYNETIRVPLMIKIPGTKSQKIKTLSQGIDIFPTILQIVGIKPIEQLEGESLTDLIKGKRIERKSNYIVSEKSDTQKTIVDKKWKAYFKDYKNITSENVELYDLENDLYEQKNLAKKYPEMVNFKIDQLKDFLSKSKNVNQVKYEFPEWIDNIKREKLVNEGYF